MSELENAEVMIGREDWEKFLSSMERLMSLHEKTLNKQKELTTRNEALRQELRDALRIPTTTRVTGLTREPGAGIIERVQEWLNPSRKTPAYVQASNLRCGNCGYGIMRPSAFCERCGVPFGGLFCRCGRELAPNDKFCDSCGQRILG